MLNNLELAYREIVNRILVDGEERSVRNGTTKTVFGEVLSFSVEDNKFPILTGRQIFYKGVLGELAAILRGPKSVKDFEDNGCNYWKLWARDDGSINVDYGNTWLNFGGVNQIEALVDSLKNKPTQRRHIITGWDPANLGNVDLPCCHMLYQFFVTNNKELDMIWYQRSVDVMIGLPSDMILAGAWLIILANELGFKPRYVHMHLGDTHIYKEHWDNAGVYMARDILPQPVYTLTVPVGIKHTEFRTDWIGLYNYQHAGKLNFELLK